MKPAPDRDGAAVRVPPPLVFLGALVLGVLLHAFALPWRVALPFTLRAIAGGGIALLGIGLMGLAVRLFARTGQDPKPWKPTPEIVTAGAYRWTRNPMYVGMTLLEVGSGIVASNAWIVVLALPAAALVHYTAVVHEEAYLERKFEEEYRRYKRRVRRWV